MRRSRLVVAILTAVALVACRDISRFSSRGDRFEGEVVKGSFVRSGVGAAASMCLTLDTDHLQDAPGTLTTSDGRFAGAPLRPIPQIWHDPLSTLRFGEARVRNLVYVASPNPDAGETSDVMVVVSLMQNGELEVRLLRGAPQPDAGPPPPGRDPALYAVFSLTKQEGSCSIP